MFTIDGSGSVLFKKVFDRLMVKSKSHLANMSFELFSPMKYLYIENNYEMDLEFIDLKINAE